jgi:hypothetical protein
MDLSAAACPSCGKAPAAPAASSQDADHLKVLSLFHYIVAGITALFSCFPLIHVAMGIAMATGGFDDSHGHPPPAAFGWIFAALGCAFVVAGWALAVFIYLGGRWIAARRRHTLCLVVAGVSCLLMPFGTVLGVFTLVVLMKPQVKALFDVSNS